VLFAMGKDVETVRSTVRFTFGPEITKEDVDDIVETIRKCVKKVRSVSAIRIYKNKVEL
jgi:cysteine sulfinate desulfinase/cysteine desulfurase-like protein